MSGANFPPVIRRSPDDIAEALTLAETAAANIIASLPSKTFDQLGSVLTSELGVYDLEAVRELGRNVI